jgi:hypothetical protein
MMSSSTIHMRSSSDEIGYELTNEVLRSNEFPMKLSKALPDELTNEQ